ncbi:hypothetical protein evm_001830 [Chilo suppressalis]|nr:hypothetical protein evm_001830 [Chilo suppressalis]
MFIQTMKYFLLTIMLSPCWSQIPNTEMRPDVTFDDRNDRFDITELVAQQNMFLDSASRAMQQADFRRNSRKDLSKQAAALRKNTRSNKDHSDFAMVSEEDNNLDEFNRSLKVLQNSRRFRKVLDYLRKKRTRRGNDNPADMERDALLQYAVPVVMKINGYIRAPLD